GRPQEVYDRPANLFVAEFIGSPSMNFLEAEAERLDGELCLRAAGAVVRLPPELAAAVQAAGAPAVVLGIRPEHLVPHEGDGSAFAATFTGQVDLVESLGNEQHVTLALPDASLVVRLPTSFRVETGSTLRVAVEAQHLHLFDAETKRRIGA
ncbi:MAG: TOBE domain-containing protein, partial [Dehalococcoidia bacterium]|nr:TOBE domain-containing protein [Dehalococcoidia bacterium]